MQVTPREQNIINEVCHLVEENKEQIVDFLVTAIRLWESGEKLIDDLDKTPKMGHDKSSFEKI